MALLLVDATLESIEGRLCRLEQAGRNGTHVGPEIVVEEYHCIAIKLSL
jgi:hypothetical protein